MRQNTQPMHPHDRHSHPAKKMLALPQLPLKKAARCSEAEEAMPIPGEATQ
ncbi:hypothetical protein [Xanthomonas vasicola]|uniref:hypothetical protein n=1 Tax=Xanthomonas vasicola TaxID=56459 RepID=UPI000A76C7EA|nr:hypothetical protein [Xanthomonas vasicola]